MMICETVRRKVNLPQERRRQNEREREDWRPQIGDLKYDDFVKRPEAVILRQPRRVGEESRR